MLCIAFVLPSPAMVPVVHEAWELHEKYFGKDPNLRYTVDCEIQPENVVSKHYDADVIVCRGGTAAALKKRNCLIPVVEIPVTSGDIAYSIKEVIRQYGKMPVGVVGTINTVRGFYFMNEKFPVPVKVYETSSVNLRDLIDGMERAVADGCKLIIAGHSTCHYCEEHSIPSGLILSSVESVFLAITEAKRSASIAMRERQNNMIFRGVIDHVFEGIIAVDQDNRIRTFNPYASQLLSRRAEDCLGQPISLVLPESRLTALLTGSKSCSNEVMKINGTNCVLNSVPMMHEGQRLGMLVTFQAEQSIATAESHLRSRLVPGQYTAHHHFDDLVGNSAVLRMTVRRAQHFAHADGTILIQGETGTEKNVFAEAIHIESERANGPFVTVDCAALAVANPDRKLFGCCNGEKNEAGLIEYAQDGTLFLNDIDELPIETQGRLMRVLEQHELCRTGDDRPFPVNVRMICASSKDISMFVQEGLFREDLYYLISELMLRIPPVRERERDSLLIFRHYLNYYAGKFGKAPFYVSPEAETRLLSQNWDGNVQEIRNISEQLAVICDDPNIREKNIKDVLPKIPLQQGRNIQEPLEAASLQDLEKKQIAEVLARTSSRKEAAELLGISKTTLWRKCKEFGME